MVKLEVRRRSAIADARHVDGLAAIAFGWWERQRRSVGILPAPLALVPPTLALSVEASCLLDVRQLNPLRFEFAIVDRTGTNVFPDLAALAEHGGRLRDHHRSLYDDLVTATFSGTPAYLVVESRTDTESVVYRRVILPLADDGSRVSQLLIVLAADRPFTP